MGYSIHVFLTNIHNLRPHIVHVVRFSFHGCKDEISSTRRQPLQLWPKTVATMATYVGFDLTRFLMDDFYGKTLLKWMLCGVPSMSGNLHIHSKVELHPQASC